MNHKHTPLNKRNKRTSPENPQKISRGAAPQNKNNVARASTTINIKNDGETSEHKRGKKSNHHSGKSQAVANKKSPRKPSENRSTEQAQSQRKQTGRNRQSGQLGQSRRRNHKGNNNHEIYDIFGARVQNKWRSQSNRKSYRSEYCQIDLPQKPENLVCGICNQSIDKHVELLEALEILPGEFTTQFSTQAAPQADDMHDKASAHFQCVLKNLRERTQLEAGESIAYLGAGQFAVVQGPQRIVKRMLERSEWNQNSSLSPTNWATWRQDMSSHALVATLSIKTDV